MSIELEYSSKEEALEELDLTLEETNKILDENMEEWFNAIVIPEAKRMATAMNLPKGFIDGIEFVKKGKNEGSVINTWGSKKKPLAKWFNYGTIDHWIQAFFKKVLSWISKGPSAGNNPSAIFFRSANNESGRRFFSKGHYVSGLQRTEAMEFGVRQGKKQLIRQLPSLIQGELE